MKVDISGLDYREVNDIIRAGTGGTVITGALGQRFLAAGTSGKDVSIYGVPGNALGAYLNGGRIEVFGNAQDAAGDTMNDSEIIIHGSIGDAAGYAMRGGRIYVEGDAGYRAGIHMKAYRDKVPVMVIGGAAGSFLGEYQAGGIIIVLGLKRRDGRIVGNFPCTGMHGGMMFIRESPDALTLPAQVTARAAGEEDISSIRGFIEAYSGYFGADPGFILGHPFTVITPDSGNPYKQMYVAN